MTLPVDFTSQTYLRDPAAGIERLRTTGPVVEVKFPIVGKVWITTTQEMAGRVLKDSDTFNLRRNGATAGMRSSKSLHIEDSSNRIGIKSRGFQRRPVMSVSTGEIVGTNFDTTKKSLKELLGQAQSGLLQLPDFQRGWVWDDEGIRSLLASISQSFPVGAIMTLEEGGEGATG